MGHRQQARRWRSEEKERPEENVVEEGGSEKKRSQDRAQENVPLASLKTLPEIAMRLIILVILLLLILGALPTWPYSAGWGYYPSGGGLLILIVVAVLLLRR